MSDTPQTPEAVALQLLLLVGAGEGKKQNDGTMRADKQWLLDTYGECLSVVRDPGSRRAKSAIEAQYGQR